MTKKRRSCLGRGLLVCGILTAALAPCAFADDPFVKLGRGLTNILTSPCELFLQTIDVDRRHDPLTAIFSGPPKGVLLMAARILTGAYEIVTFPLPVPAGYKPLWEPATIFEAFERKDFQE